MSKTLFGYLCRTYLALVGGTLAALVSIFLVVDFVDRAKMYSGPNWIADVAVLYGYKALMAIHQLGPAALLLAAGTAVSLVRKRGELTALSSLSFGPVSFYAPILLCALAASMALSAFDEAVVVKASQRVDQISSQRFNRWGDWYLFFVPQKWFRREDRIFYLRGGNPDRGFEDVTILKLTPDFRLAERLDADRMSYVGGTQWLFTGIVVRRFTGPASAAVEVLDRAEYDLGATAKDFRILPGRPEQMKLSDLREQVRARNQAGLASNQFALAMHNRFAYPLTALPAAALTVGFALRSGRKGHVTAALLEGLVVTLALWGMLVICRTLALAERLAPAVAAWAPFGILSVAAALIWLRHEGKLAVAARARRLAI
jgi:lipopolysaccharide export system permease protein